MVFICTGRGLGAQMRISGYLWVGTDMIGI